MAGSNPRVVVVVGGGLSGLATAFLLSKQGHEVTLVERERLGGKIVTDRLEGYLCERGPAGFLDNTAETRTLVAALGLAPISAAPAARNRFVYFRGKLERVPLKPPELVTTRLLSLAGKLRILVEPFVRRAKSEGKDETVYAFARRRLGRQVADRLVFPMVAGIFAGDPRELSVAAAFPRLVQMEQEHGSLLRALRKQGTSNPAAMHSFPGGMETLPRALAATLGERIRIDEVLRLEPTGTRFRVRTGSGEREADAVVVATPPDAAVTLLGTPGSSLAEIPTVAVDVCCLGYPRDRVRHDLDGFGFLVGPDEDLGILGCLFESSLFPGRAPEGHVLVRVMLGGAREPGVASLAAQEVIGRAKTAVARVLGIASEPTFTNLVRWPRAIPQYTPGHRARVAAVGTAERATPGLFVTGVGLRGVGVNDCIREAYAVAARVGAHLGAG